MSSNLLLCVLRKRNLLSTAGASTSFLTNAAKDRVNYRQLPWLHSSKGTFFGTSHDISSRTRTPSSSERVTSSGSVEQVEEQHPDAEKEPLPEWPEGVNPETREQGGPRGPEPTRYGDWERKGRVSDF